VPLTVANFILGGAFTSRLSQNLRESRGYTYGASSALSAPRWQGTFIAAASVRTPVTAAAVHEFLAEFRRIQAEPVSQEELDRAKRAIIGRFALTLENPAGVLERTLELVDYGLPADYWDTYPEKVEAVTPADVQRVMRKYVADERLQLVAVGERSQIEAGLREYGPIEAFDAEGRPAGAP
jgi:zinc protease